MGLIRFLLKGGFLPQKRTLLHIVMRKRMASKKFCAGGAEMAERRGPLKNRRTGRGNNFQVAGCIPKYCRTSGSYREVYTNATF